MRIQGEKIRVYVEGEEIGLSKALNVNWRAHMKRSRLYGNAEALFVKKLIRYIRS